MVPYPLGWSWNFWIGALIIKYHVSVLKICPFRIMSLDCFDRPWRRTNMADPRTSCHSTNIPTTSFQQKNYQRRLKDLSFPSGSMQNILPKWKVQYGFEQAKCCSGLMNLLPSYPKVCLLFVPIDKVNVCPKYKCRLLIGFSISNF